MKYLFFLVLSVSSCRHTQKEIPKNPNAKVSLSIPIISAFLDGNFQSVETLKIVEGNLESLQYLVKAETLFMLEQYDEAQSLYMKSDSLENNTYASALADLCSQMDDVASQNNSFFEKISTLTKYDSFTYPNGYLSFLEIVKKKWVINPSELKEDVFGAFISKQMFTQEKINSQKFKNHYIYQWILNYDHPFNYEVRLDDQNRLVEIFMLLNNKSTPPSVLQKKYFDDFEDEQFKISANYLFNEFGPIYDLPRPLSVDWNYINVNIDKLPENIKNELSKDLFSQQYSSKTKDALTSNLIKKGFWPKLTRKSARSYVDKKEAIQFLETSERLEILLSNSINLTLITSSRKERTLASNKGSYRPSFLNRYFNEL